MNTREYIPPSLKELLERAFLLRKTYTRDNPERLRLIALLENMSLYISKILFEQEKLKKYIKDHPNLPQNDPIFDNPILKITEDELHKMFLGAWFFVDTHIDKGYSWLSSVYTRGFFIDTGSTLRRSILQQLNILDKDYKFTENIPSEAYKYKRVINFHNFGFTARYDDIHTAINHDFSTSEPIDDKRIEGEMIDVIRKLFIKVAEEFKKIWKGIPLPEVDKVDLENLPENYEKAKEKEREEAYLKFLHNDNPLRVFYAQLASTVAGISDDQNDYRGIRLYIAYMIAEEYSVLSPTGSQLYVLIMELLNIVSLNDISNEKQREHLISVKKLLEHPDTAKKIADYAKETFKEKNLLNENINSKLDEVTTKIKKITDSLLSPNHENKWFFAKLFAAVGSYLGSAPGFVLGSIFGFTLSETQKASDAKSAIGTLVTKTSEMMGNQSGGWFGYLMGDIFFRRFLMQFCGTTFAFVFMLAGAAAGGALGGSVDVVWKKFLISCEKSKEYYAKLNDPKPLLDCDGEMFEAFLDTPSEVVGLKDKEHLQKIGKNLIERMAEGKSQPIAILVP